MISFRNYLLVATFLFIAPLKAKAQQCVAYPGALEWGKKQCPIGHGGAGGACVSTPDSICVQCYNPDLSTYELPVPSYCPHKDPGKTGGPGDGPPGGPGAGPGCGGSLVFPIRQILQESVAIVGTPFSLHYSNDRVPGYTAGQLLTIQLAPGNATYVSHMLSVDVDIAVAGNNFPHTDSTITAQEMYYYAWNGLDSGSSPVYGTSIATVTLTKTLDGTLPPEPPFVYDVKAFRYNVKKYGLGGWMLSIHHFYDPISETVFLGNGRSYSAKSIATGGGGFMTFSQDAEEAYVFDSNGKHLNTLNGLKGTTKYTFSYTGDVLDSVTDAYSNVTTINHSSGNPTSIVSPYGQTTILSVDGNGYLDEITNPNSETTTITYTGSGGLLNTFEKPNGVISTMTYDGYGRLTSDVSSAGNSLTLTATDQGIDESVMKREVVLETSEGLETTFAIENGIGISQYITQNSGMNDRTHTFNMLGQEEINLDSYARLPNGNIVRTTYSKDGRLGDLLIYPSKITTTTPVGNVLTETISRAANLSTPGNVFSLVSASVNYGRNNKATTNNYHAGLSRFTKTTAMGSNTVTYVDSQERPTSVQFASFTPVTYTYDANGRLEEMAQGVSRTWEMTYDLNGYLASVENPLNQTTSYGYDGAGRVTSVTLPDTRVIAYGYDSMGNLTSVTPPSKPAQDMSYNGFDLISEYLNATPTTYDYDNDRRITKITRPSGDEIEYTYNANGRLTAIDIPTGTFSITPRTDWDKYTAITSPDGVVQSYSWSGDLLMSTSNSGATVGSLVMSYKDYFKISTTKVDSQATRDYDYNDDELLVGAGGETITRTSATGFPSQISLNSVLENYTYNSNYGELSGIEAKYSSTNIYKATYTRDALGRITQKVEKVGGGSNQTYDYTYDSAGRLTDVELNGSPLNSYTYDTNGNRLSATYSGVTTNATYTSGDQLIDYGVFDYSYNVNGELDTITDTSSIPSGVTSFTYDAIGNLKSVTLASSTTYNYLYDGMNRRVGKKNGSTLVRQYLWLDQLKIAAEYDGSGTLISEFIYGDKPNVPDLMINGGVKYKIVTDHLGSVVAVVHSTAGTVVQRIAYDEFGRVISDTNPGFQPFGFAGGLYDPDTGLVRFGARDYDAETGRWMQKDPILFAGGDTNLYGYVLNDPINFIDPNGQSAAFTVSCMIGGAALVGWAGVKTGNPWVAGIGVIAGAGLGYILCDPPKPPPPPTEPPRTDPRPKKQPWRPPGSGPIDPPGGNPC